MKRISAVFACMGAIIGAGFASGREVMAFFTCYGHHSWWLIAVTAAVMTWICWLYMNTPNENGEWITLFGKRSRWPVIISCCLMVITGGAMISAAGHLCSLVSSSACAEPVGALATLAAAWMISRRSLKTMGWISAVLSILLIGVLCAALRLPQRSGVPPMQSFSAGSLIRALICAAAYAAMNGMLASGVMCRCEGGRWTAAGVGGMLAVLLGLSNALYLRHPELLNAALPMVALLNGCGRMGFVISAVLMYLSVLTTLTAVMCALRTAADHIFRSQVLKTIFGWGVPLAVSQIGFSGIVDAIYAPAGLICLLTIFLPLQHKLRKQSNA